MTDSIHFLIAMVFGVIILGLILRYGKSTNSILTDVNNIFGTLTLSGSNVMYYGPQ